MNLYGLFNAKAILVEKQQWYYLTHSNKRVHTFPMGISLKVNLITQLEFKHAYFKAPVLYISNYATGLDLLD